MVCDFAVELTTEPGLPTIHYSERVSDTQCQSSLPKFIAMPGILTLQRQEEAEFVRTILFQPKRTEISMVLAPTNRTFCNLSKLIKTVLSGQKSAVLHRKNLFPFVLE